MISLSKRDQWVLFFLLVLICLLRSYYLSEPRRAEPVKEGVFKNLQTVTKEERNPQMIQQVPGGLPSPVVADAADVNAPLSDEDQYLFEVDLNVVGLTELSLLPGIGPRLAIAIIELREAKGGFRRPDEIMQVPGIGPKTFAKVERFLVVGDQVPVAKPTVVNKTIAD